MQQFIRILLPIHLITHIVYMFLESHFIPEPHVAFFTVTPLIPLRSFVLIAKMNHLMIQELGMLVKRFAAVLEKVIQIIITIKQLFPM